MLNFIKILDEKRVPNKKDPTNVQNTPKNLHSCNSRLHDANDQDSSISRVTLSSRPQSRKNSISSCQTEPNPVTTNQ